jgi:hypothetical protein
MKLPANPHKAVESDHVTTPRPITYVRGNRSAAMASGIIKISVDILSAEDTLPTRKSEKWNSFAIRGSTPKRLDDSKLS